MNPHARVWIAGIALSFAFLVAFDTGHLSASDTAVYLVGALFAVAFGLAEADRHTNNHE